MMSRVLNFFWLWLWKSQCSMSALCQLLRPKKYVEQHRRYIKIFSNFKTECFYWAGAALTLCSTPGSGTISHRDSASWQLKTLQECVELLTVWKYHPQSTNNGKYCTFMRAIMSAIHQKKLISYYICTSNQVHLMPFRCPKTSSVTSQQAIEMKAQFGIFNCINWIFFSSQKEVAAAGFSTAAN